MIDRNVNTSQKLIGELPNAKPKSPASRKSFGRWPCAANRRYGQEICWVPWRLLFTPWKTPRAYRFWVQCPLVADVIRERDRQL